MNKFQSLIQASFVVGLGTVGLAFLAILYFDWFAPLDNAIRRMIVALPFCGRVTRGGAEDLCDPLFWWSVSVGLVAGFVIIAIAMGGYYLMRDDPDVQAGIAKAQANLSKPE